MTSHNGAWRQPLARASRFLPAVAGAALLLGGLPSSLHAQQSNCVVGVSWNNFQEERWAKWDEPAIKAALAAGGATYISNDAKSSAETQASNVENLISQGANVADHPGPGRHGDQAGRGQRGRPGHPGHRLRPADRGSAGAVHHLRQRRGRAHAGAGRVRACSRRATTSSSRATRPTRTPTSCAAATTRSSRTPSTAATSRSSARPIPTTGIRRRRRPRWSSS